MKLIAVILMSVLMQNGCQDKDVAINDVIVEYNAVSRGYYRQVVIDKGTLHYRDKRDGVAEVRKLTATELSELTSLYKNVDVDKLSGYKGPTQKRFYDGAAIANLQLTVKGKVYKTEDFDHRNPPVEIQDFVNRVASFIKE